MAAHVSLSNGVTAYWLSFGTGRASGNDRHEASIEEPLVDNIKLAINLGFTNIDTAERYGSERAVGKAIKESNLPREQLYIVTKIFAGVEDPEQDIKSSLARLGVEYVDQYLIHSPEFKKMMNLDISLKEVWQNLETLVDKGYTKSIGISNAEIHHLEEIISFARIKPVRSR
jgi:diketogulonate reductase-like aldo/keto reductase